MLVEEHADSGRPHGTPAASSEGGTIRVEPSWRDSVAQLQEDPNWRTAFVVGPSDSGKTTFCRYLACQLAQNYRTAAIDCDPGQTRLSVPTTLALAWEPWDGQAPVAARFVGSTRPVGHFLQAVTSVRRLLDRGLQIGAEKLVLDSCGYINTDAGREFHFQTLDVTDPDYVVALQSDGELEPLLASFERRVRPRIFRPSISPAAASKPAADRRSNRERRFRRYFAGGRRYILRTHRLGLHGMVPSLQDPASLRHLLVGLCDRRGFVLVLAIVEGVDPEQSVLHVYAPPFRPDEVASVQFGTLFLTRSGRELQAQRQFR